MATEKPAKLSLTERLLNNSTSKHAAILSKSQFFVASDVTQTPIPMLNVAFSGEFTGGFVPGITMWAAPSRHFKTLFGLIQAAAYLRKYSDAVLLLYDCEFGSPIKYFTSVGIDPNRVVHVPFLTIEELRTDITNQLKGIARGDHVIVMIDSMGNAASEKEVHDAEAGSDKADMTRAKVAKSMFRIITPHFKMKDINLIVIQHVYQTLEIYSKTIMSGGTGGMLAADNVFFIGKQQEKDGDERIGYNFIINTEKSRFVRDKMKIPITVKFEGGVDIYSGIFDLALEFGLIVTEKKGYYKKVNPDTGEVHDSQFKASQIEKDKDYLKSLVDNDKFAAFIKKTYQLPEIDLV